MSRHVLVTKNLPRLDVTNCTKIVKLWRLTCIIIRLSYLCQTLNLHSTVLNWKNWFFRNVCICHSWLVFFWKRLYSCMFCYPSLYRLKFLVIWLQLKMEIIREILSHRLSLNDLNLSYFGIKLYHDYFGCKCLGTLLKCRCFIFLKLRQNSFKSWPKIVKSTYILCFLIMIRCIPNQLTFYFFPAYNLRFHIKLSCFRNDM